MYFYIVKSNAMSIESQIKRFQGELPAGVKLLAVSKFHPVEAIVEAYEAGQRAFGESRPQELKQKYEVLPHDIEWHMIGHLQTNKVKYIAPFVHLIESLDSERLAEEIERQAAKCNRVIDCLLEIHVTAEDSKSGWDYAELLEFVRRGGFNALPHIRLRGVMGMATFTDDEAVVCADFERLAACKAELAEYFGEEFDTLSMGMSDDYRLAIEYGSTEVRIGSTIFGERVY
jgi:pyridoxal phosphate enzyme (YggS family)